MFEILNNILYNKTKLEFDVEKQQEFNPYMIQRWITMRSKDFVKLINLTTNKLHHTIDSKDMWYKLFMAVIPKVKYRRINYINKQSKLSETEKNIDDIVNLLSKNNEMSTREIRNYITEYNIDISNIEKVLK